MHRNLSHHLGVLLTLAIFATCHSFPRYLSAQGTTETILQTGDAVQDGSGTFLSMSRAFLNDAGQISFFSTLTDPGPSDTGIFMTDGGGQNWTVARAGQLTPRGDGVFFNFNPANMRGLNAQGHVLYDAFLVNTSGGFANDTTMVIELGNNSPFELVREGDLAPDGNGRFGDIQGQQVSFSDAGSAVFWHQLSNTSGGVVDAEGVFSARWDSLNQIAREDTFFNTTALGRIVELRNSSAINSLGQVVFSGIADDQGTLRDFIAVRRTPNITDLIAIQNEAAPGNGIYQALIARDINDAGQVLFEASVLRNNGESEVGLFRNSQNGTVQLLQLGQGSPDGNGSIEFARQSELNNRGQLAFASVVEGSLQGPNDDSGFFVTSIRDDVQVVAREGQLLPDGNGTIGQLVPQSAFQPSVPFAFNDAGALAFVVDLNNTAGGSFDDEAILIGDGRDLLQVVRKGDSINGQIVTDLDFVAHSELTQSGLNNYGQVAYTATLGNGDSLVRLWTPELHYRETIDGSWNGSSSWTLGLTPAHVHDVRIDPDASVVVFGPTSDTTVKSLEIGGGNGIATLELRSGATLTSGDTIRIFQNGVLTGDGRLGSGVANFGTILPENLTFAAGLTNRGIIQGGGGLNGDITNAIDGQIRVDPGKYLNLDGLSFNNVGGVQVIGGELEVDSRTINNSGTVEVIGGTFRSGGGSLLQNAASTGLITSRDGILRFDDGLVNHGSIGISFGTTDIFGDVANEATGIINVSGGANVTFFEDLDQNGTMIVAKAGSSTSTAVLFGEFAGTGGFAGGGDVYAFGDLRPGASPASVLMDGSLFLSPSTDTFIELADAQVGLFDQMIVTGDLSLSGDLFVDLIDGFALRADQEFLIADVFGLLDGQFNGLTEGALVGMFGRHELYISYLAGDGNDVALFTPIPEPAFGLVSLMAAVLIVVRRRRINSLPTAPMRHNKSTLEDHLSGPATKENEDCRSGCS